MESESEVAQLCPTLSDPMDCSLPGSSVHGISRQECWSGVLLPSPMVSLTCDLKTIQTNTHATRNQTQVQGLTRGLLMKNLLPRQETWARSWVRMIPWRRKWQPTPVFLPGESYGQRSLAGYSPWGSQRVGHDLATAQILSDSPE